MYIDKFKEPFLLQYENNPENMEKALYCIKNLGATQTDSVAVLVFVLKMPLPEAKMLVLNSSTWSANYAANIQLMEDFHNALQKLAAITKNNQNKNQ